MGEENIFTGPGIFVWGVNEDGTNAADAITFDLTQGGIRFLTETNWHQVTVDQYGDVPIDEVSTGTTGRVEFESAEVDYEKNVKFDTQIYKVTDSADSSKVKYQVTALAGKRLPRKRAVIKPQGITDPSRYIFIEECAIKFDADFGFQNGDNLKMPMNVSAYPSLSATPKGLLYTWGDISATA